MDNLPAHSKEPLCTAYGSQVNHTERAILILFFFFKAESEKDALGGALGLSFGYAEPLPDSIKTEASESVIVS